MVEKVKGVAICKVYVQLKDYSNSVLAETVL